MIWKVNFPYNPCSCFSFISWFLKGCTPRDALSPVSVVGYRWGAWRHLVGGFISWCRRTRHINIPISRIKIILKHRGVDKLIERMWLSRFLRCHWLIRLITIPIMFQPLREAQFPITTLHSTKLTNHRTNHKSIIWNTL